MNSFGGLGGAFASGTQSAVMMPPAPNAAANHAVVAFVVLTGASVAVMLPRVRRALEQLPDARPTTPGALPPEVEHRE